MSFSSTATIIIFFCYGKEQFENNKYLKLKETTTFSILRLLSLQPSGALMQFCFFCDAHDCTFFPFKFSFWNHILLKKHIFLLSWLSDTRCSLSGVVRKNTHCLENYKWNVRMSTAMSWDYTSIYCFHSDSSSLLEGKLITSWSVWNKIKSGKIRTYLLCSWVKLKIVLRRK